MNLPTSVRNGHCGGAVMNAFLFFLVERRQAVLKCKNVCLEEELVGRGDERCQ